MHEQVTTSVPMIHFHIQGIRMIGLIRTEHGLLIHIYITFSMFTFTLLLPVRLRPVKNEQFIL